MRSLLSFQSGGDAPDIPRTSFVGQPKAVQERHQKGSVFFGISGLMSSFGSPGHASFVKHADPDARVLVQAKTEYSSLH